MLKRITNKIKRLKTGLTSINQQPIGKSVLTIVLFLDLFILISIFDGLDDHTRQLTSPYEFIPQHCRDIVIDDDWNPKNSLIRIANIADNHRGSYFYLDESLENEERHPICAPISTLLGSINKDKVLSSSLSQYLNQRALIEQTRSEYERVSSAYDTLLLQTIAKQGQQQTAQSLEVKVEQLTNELNELVRKEAELVATLKKNANIEQLIAIVSAPSKQNREVLLDDLRRLNFWYPVKRLAMELLFLGPLILMFYFWNSRSILAGRPYQTLVSAHLLVVAFIPVIFKVLELIYDIVPKKFLGQLFELLEALHLVAIWHYVMMGAGVLGALALIYVLQKKIFSQEKIRQKRIAYSQCQECGVHLPRGNKACSTCGFKQFRQCSHCIQDTYVYGEYCRVCGEQEPIDVPATD